MTTGQTEEPRERGPTLPEALYVHPDQAQTISRHILGLSIYQENGMKNKSVQGFNISRATILYQRY